MKSYYKTRKGKEIVEQKYRNILTKWPVENRQYHVETSVGSTFVIESGKSENPPLLLIHGSVSNSATWFYDVAKLSNNYHLFAVDIIGDAGLSEEVRPSLKSGAYELWIKELLEGLNIKSCFIAGLSLGGWMALNFALHYPEKVDGLFLISSSGLAKVNISLMWKLVFYTLTGRADKTMTLLNGGKSLEQSPELKSATEFTTLTSKHYKSRKESIPLFTSQQLSQLNMPICVVYGERDCFFSAEDAAKSITHSAPHAKAIILPETGHIVVRQAGNMVDFFKGIDL